MIRLFLTLALLLPLAADATINAASFQREVILCADGTRQARYPAGADTCLPEVTADYTQDWSGFSLSGNAYAALDAAADLDFVTGTPKTPTQDPATYQIVNTHYRDSANKKALYIRNDGSIKDPAGKHRAEIRYGLGTANFDPITAGTKVCVGYSVYIDSATWPSLSLAQKFAITGQWAKDSPYTEGTTYFYSGSGGKVQFREHYRNANYVVPAYYQYRKNMTNVTTGSPTEFSLNTWYDIVQEYVFDPTGYAGSWKVWVTDTSDDTKTLMVDVSNVQTGFPADTQEPRWKLGVYWGSTDIAAVAGVYFGPIRMHQSDTCEGAVQPRGTPGAGP